MAKSKKKMLLVALSLVPCLTLRDQVAGLLRVLMCTHAYYTVRKNIRYLGLVHPELLAESSLYVHFLTSQVLEVTRPFSLRVLEVYVR